MFVFLGFLVQGGQIMKKNFEKNFITEGRELIVSITTNNLGASQIEWMIVFDAVDEEHFPTTWSGIISSPSRSLLNILKNNNYFESVWNFFNPNLTKLPFYKGFIDDNFNTITFL